MSQRLNCPNCGAPLGLSDKCEYCGTHFTDCTMDTAKPFYIKIRHNGMIYIDKVMMENTTVSTGPPDTLATYGLQRRLVINEPPRREYTINLISLGVPEYLVTDAH